MEQYHTLKRKTASWKGRTKKSTAALGTLLADKECVENWVQMLCMTEKLLNSSVKKPLGAPPNTRLFGNAINIHEPVGIKDMDQQNDKATPGSIH